MLDPGAQRFDDIAYVDVLKEGYQVMDATAIVMCRENNLPLVVFNLNNAGDLLRVVRGETLGTSVANDLPATGTTAS